MDQSQLSQLKRQIKRGNFRLSAGEYEGAIDAFLKARDILPDSVEILLTLGKIALNLGKFEEGIRHFRDALSIEESDLVYSNLGVALTINNQWDEAYEILSQVKEPDTLSSYCLGICSLYVGKSTSETDDLLKNPPSGLKFPGIALVYHNRGMHNKALTEFRNYGGSWNIYHAMGVENIYLGSRSVANSYFRQALERYLNDVPQNEQEEKIRAQLEFDCIITGPNPTQRIEDLIEYSEKYPSFKSFYATATAEYEANGFTPFFRTYLEKAVRLMENNELDMNDVNYWLSQVED